MHYTILFYFILCVRLALASTRVIYKLDLSSVSFCARSSLGAESVRCRRRRSIIIIIIIVVTVLAGNNIIPIFRVPARTLRLQSVRGSPTIFFPVIFIVYHFFLSTRYALYTIIIHPIQYIFIRHLRFPMTHDTTDATQCDAGGFRHETTRYYSTAVAASRRYRDLMNSYN